MTPVLQKHEFFRDTLVFLAFAPLYIEGHDRPVLGVPSSLLYIEGHSHQIRSSVVSLICWRAKNDRMSMTAGWRISVSMAKREK